jgi:SsuE family FMN reductase
VGDLSHTIPVASARKGAANINAVAISGSPRTLSKSKALAELLLEALAARGCSTQLIDLATLDAEALVARRDDAGVSDAIAAVGAAQIVVAATPTYRALYTGLLKCFFDLMPQAYLAGKVCVPVQTAGVPHHSLSVEYGLRPLFASLEGLSTAGVYATDAEFTDGAPNDDLRVRIKRAAEAAMAIVTGSAG